MNESPSNTARQHPCRRDRLVALIALLGDGKLHRAQDLAKKTSVSTRSIYRDMETLMQSGVPVSGQRGTGYRMTAPVTLPPINLSMAELEALHLGVAVMTGATDPGLQNAARSLAEKLDAALPEGRIAASTGWGLAVHPFAETAAGVAHIPALRRAVRNHLKLRLRYQEPGCAAIESVVRPIALDYWGRVWTCSFWCETSAAFRTLRIDNIRELVEMSADFKETAERLTYDFTLTEQR